MTRSRACSSTARSSAHRRAWSSTPPNNLWVIDGGNGSTIAPSLEEFTETQLKNLKKNPTPTPNVQITSDDTGLSATGGLRRVGQYVG